MENTRGLAGFSVMHLGSHIICNEPTTEEAHSSIVCIGNECLTPPQGKRRLRRTGRLATLDDMRALFEGIDNRRSVRFSQDDEASAKQQETVARFKEGSRKLANAHELVMVLPWPLLHRARCVLLLTSLMCGHYELAKPHLNRQEKSAKQRRPLKRGCFPLSIHL
jgi:hypothetical protein